MIWVGAADPACTLVTGVSANEDTGWPLTKCTPLSVTATSRWSVTTFGLAVTVAMENCPTMAQLPKFSALAVLSVALKT